jgi:hypothetical protein
MKIKFFSQHFMLYVYEITKVHGHRDKYLVLIHDTPAKWEEMAMVGKIERTRFRIIAHVEVFL